MTHCFRPLAAATLLLVGVAISSCQPTVARSVAAVPKEATVSTVAPVSEQILVDQFGWRAAATRKVALIADPTQGQNKDRRYTPGDTFELRRADDGRTVFTGKTVAWRDGEVHTASGDRVWSCDFSTFRTPGRYVLYDPRNDRASYPFELRDSLYRPVLTVSVRTFYYQRCGTSIDAKHGGAWTHDPCHIGPNQDRAAQLHTDAPQGQPRDVSGGWHDAGDDTKYVAFLPSVLGDLMMAYERHPSAFPDDTGIPESGNGVPDLLDEIRWELDWLLKMQAADGSVRNRVSEKSYANGKGPAEDTQPRYYTRSTTWATATFAATLAHAARLFPPFEKRYPGYAARLLGAARRAWTYLEKTPAMTPADGKDGAQMAAAPGDSNPQADKRLRLWAAAELFATTHEPGFDRYVRENAHDKSGTADQGQHPLVDGMIDPARSADLVRAFVVYAETGGADSKLTEEIKTVLKNTMERTLVPAYEKQDDPYRGFMWDGHYAWGSNQQKANWAKIALHALRLNVAPERNALYEEIAEEYLHYFHGRNPLGFVYLTNMGERGAKLGASKSVMEVYHHWFQDGSPLYDGPGSKLGPAPGFVPGGPNYHFTRKWIAPPYGEPPMKAYREWNTGWNNERRDTENSWEITEPAIYYQAAYTMLLAAFAR
ncbi:MAG: glycoside hydrolase family 9 protein [Capsulimonadales bacterium]|nr:glycoside hydrolase family 9 protein [Capsulimonadales bacterium]